MLPWKKGPFPGTILTLTDTISVSTIKCYLYASTCVFIRYVSCLQRNETYRMSGRRFQHQPHIGFKIQIDMCEEDASLTNEPWSPQPAPVVDPQSDAQFVQLLCTNTKPN